MFNGHIKSHSICPSNTLVLHSFGSGSTSSLTKVELDLVSNWIRFETL
jgi:hypothetical protein